MTTRPGPILAACSVLVVVTFTAMGASATDRWLSVRNDCDKTAFKEPESTGLDKISECVKLWWAYKDAAAATGNQRERVVSAMMRLYTQGTDEDAHLAKYALGSMKVERLPSRAPSRVGTKKTVAKAEVPKRPKCDVPEPDKKAKKAAGKIVGKGLKAYKKKKYADALEKFEEAVEAAPGWPKARYNAAAMNAIQGQEEGAMEHLYCLQDIGDGDSIEYLKKSRTDPDFEPIRDRSAAFKELTAYARIKIGNSLGEYGEDNVDNLEASLEKLGYEEIELTETGKPYSSPVVWYKPASRTAAYFVVTLMNHPKTALKIVTWDDEEFDVIVAWGDKVKKGQDPKVRVQDPADVEEEIDKLARQQDEALRQPEQAAREIDDTLETPERIADQGEDAVERVDKTVETFEKTGDNIKKAGDALKDAGSIF